MLKRFGLGFAIGYVLGARGGDRHYEQITAAARRVGELPGVRDLVADGPDSAREAGRRLMETLRDRFGGDGRDEPDDEEDAGAEEDELDEDDLRDEAEEDDERGEDESGEDEGSDERGEEGGGDRRAARQSRGGGGSRPRTSRQSQQGRQGRQGTSQRRKTSGGDRKPDREQRGGGKRGLTRLASAAIERGKVA
jgi:hypothetical protein